MVEQQIIENFLQEKSNHLAAHNRKQRVNSIWAIKEIVMPHNFHKSNFSMIFSFNPKQAAYEGKA
jgi:hypothetical protein